MENPATWGQAERLVSKTHEKWIKAMQQGLVGASLPMMVCNALREAELLVGPPVVKYACCNVLECPAMEAIACPGLMTLADNGVEFLCNSCKGRCGSIAHPEHAKEL